MADAREVVRRLIPAETRALSAYHVPAANGLLKLDAMENPYRWPPALVETWLEELRAAEVNRYPDPGGVELKRLTRKALCIPAGLELLLGNGSDELIQLVAVALRQPGRTVLTPRPTFSMYKLISVVTGFDYVGVPLTDGEFALDKAALLAAIARHQPALVFLAYPNNPTGNLFDKDHIREVIRATPGLVVIDEAYAPFAGQSLLDAPLEFPNVVVMRTLSKLGLAGLRIGLMVGPPAWMEEFEKLRLPYNIGTLNQLTANFALRHYEVLEAQAARIRQDREALYAELKTLSCIRPYPSDANFITFSVPAGRAGEVFDGLRAAGVLIKNLHGSDPALSDHLRVTVGTPEQNSRFLEALAGVLARVA